MNEGPDGYDAVEWIAQQPWCNGDVGTFGASYLAATQNALAVERPPHLRAMFTRVGTSNYWEDGAGSGGAFTLLHNLTYAFDMARTSKEAAANPALKTALAQTLQRDALSEWLSAYPFDQSVSPLRLIPAYQHWFQDWVEHSSFDEYWKQNGYTFELSYDRYPDIPIYVGGGWYDLFLRGTLNSYAGLAAQQRKSPTRLVVGPWAHNTGPRTAGDVDFGPQAEMDFQLEKLRFFDQILKGEENGMLEGRPVRLFVMGGGDGSRTLEGRLNHGGEWISVSGWPPPEAGPWSLHLHPDGGLKAQRPPESFPPTEFVFDPANPVPTIGGKIASGGQVAPGGPFDQRCDQEKILGCNDNLPLSVRRDVQVFQTPPLEEEVVVIAGPVKVVLWVSSSARDTDFTAKLIDVHPPNQDYPWGYDMLLADRILRARYRNSLERAELLEPGKVYRIEIDLLGVANRFEKGHRIRLDLSSSNYPFFDVNPNTGESGRQIRRVAAENAIYHDRKHPSHLVLSLLRKESN